MVFSRSTKEEIWDRADSKSELQPHLEGFRLETAHLSHLRNDNYNNPDNGLLVTTLEHYAHHLLFMKKPHMIGLTKSHNYFAIAETCRRAEEDARALGWSDIKFNLELRTASRLWVAKLGIKFKEG